MTFSFSQRSKDNMEGIDPRLIKIAELAIQLSPIDFGIPNDGGLRTIRRQKELFDDGVSKCDGVKKKSRHQSGLAIDFYGYVGGGLSYDLTDMATIAAAFLQAAGILGTPVQWGGLWTTFVDTPHIELLE